MWGLSSGQDKLQAACNPQTEPQQLQEFPFSVHPEEEVKMPPHNTSQLTDSHSFLQVHQKGHMPPTHPSQFSTTAVQPEENDPSFFADVTDPQKSVETDHLSDSEGTHVSEVSPSPNMGIIDQDGEISMIPLQELNKKHQNLSPPQTSYPMYGATIRNDHVHAYCEPSSSASTTSLRTHPQDSQMRQAPLHPGMASMQSRGTTKSMNLTTNPMLQHNPVPLQSSVMKEQIFSMLYVFQEILDQTIEQQHKSQVSASSNSSSFYSGPADQGNPTLCGTNSASGSMAMPSDPVVLVCTQVPPTTTSSGLGNNMKTAPKRLSVGQKTPLDVLGNPPSMASKKQKVSGAFLDQSIEQLNDVTVSGVDLRDEQLFSAPKERGQGSEATTRDVQEDAERMILEKIPLQKKLAKIISKCGILNISNDVERCLSMCVEKRIRGLIRDLIRESKQRVDIERRRHPTLGTSDIPGQISSMNQKAKEDFDKKQAEEAEKLRKLNEATREKGDKMETKAANIAVRKAVGGADMLSKWQLMAEQARQKREGAIAMASLGEEKRLGRSLTMPHATMERTVSVKDALSVLQRDPLMSKSTLVDRLYQKVLVDDAKNDPE